MANAKDAIVRYAKEEFLGSNALIYDPSEAWVHTQMPVDLFSLVHNCLHDAHKSSIPILSEYAYDTARTLIRAFVAVLECVLTHQLNKWLYDRKQEMRSRLIVTVCAQLNNIAIYVTNCDTLEKSFKAEGCDRWYERAHTYSSVGSVCSIQAAAGNRIPANNEYHKRGNRPISPRWGEAP